MKVLVTGAAGYIGSVVSMKLIEKGFSVIALDNLEQGHRNAVIPEATFTTTDLRSHDCLNQIFSDNQIDAVIHLAANALVSESMSDPQKYFHINLFCGIQLLDIMLKHNVKKLIFSSTGTLYGSPTIVPIAENHSIVPPLNTYGETKLMLERLLSRYADAYDLKFVSLRFFNVAGSYNQLGEDHDPESHLIPNIINVALGKKEYIEIFGNNYPTSDGTCIRDYIHVSDIAEAQILALQSLESNNHSKFYNVGIGQGFSVLEVVNTVKEITGFNVPVKYKKRRPGDPPQLVASSKLISNELGWQPQYTDLKDIIASAWNWHKEHPHGYDR